jgi:hypothetical protein
MQTKGGQLAQGYATRVIPLDLIYLLLLGALLGFASTTLAGIIQWPASLSNLPISGLWLLPALYIFFDFAEDLVIFVLLNWPSAIDRMFRVLTVCRTAKLAAVFAAFVQVFLLCGLSFFLPTPQFMTAHQLRSQSVTTARARLRVFPAFPRKWQHLKPLY